MSGSAIAVAAMPLARSSEGSKSGPIGLAIILLLCVGCYFLFKSMSGHLRRVREDFPAGSTTPGATPTDDGPTDAPRTDTRRTDTTPAVTQVPSTEQLGAEPVERPDRPGTD